MSGAVLSKGVKWTPKRHSLCVLLDANAKKIRPDPQGQTTCIQIHSATLKQKIRDILDICYEEKVELGVRFCNSEESQKLNKLYRGKDKPTDVLSFVPPPEILFSNLGTPASGRTACRPIGDVLICIPVCLKQAQQRGHSLQRECEVMLIHGICHLLGFDHERHPGAQRVMRALEAALLNEWSTKGVWLRTQVLRSVHRAKTPRAVRSFSDKLRS